MLTETLVVVTEVCESIGADRWRIVGGVGGPRREVEARQISQYVLHTALGWSMETVANEFMVSRPAVGNNVRRVEDARSSPDTDELVTSIETRVLSMLRRIR